MESEASSQPLERTISQQSATSVRSHRSGTARGRTRRLASQVSSSASSIAPSDKSLTSFPSLSPESPRDKGLLVFSQAPPGAYDGGTTALGSTPSSHNSASTLLDELMGGPDATPTARSTILAPPRHRNSLFEDAPPLSSQRIPGALHLADDAHIERLLARQGPVMLVRQIAADLAQRDAQITALRRRADERERALRRIIRECGLSSLDLENRLREVEAEARTNALKLPGRALEMNGDGALADMLGDAMGDHGGYGAEPYSSPFALDATIRASGGALQADGEGSKAGATTRGWKEYLWGSSTTVRKSSRASSETEESTARQVQTAVVRPPQHSERKTVLHDDVFNPPEGDPTRSSSRASSIHSGPSARKPSNALTSLALRLVAGTTTSGTRDDDGNRGRASSVGNVPAAKDARAPSAGSARTTASARAASTQGGPKALMAMRRTAGTPSSGLAAPRSQAAERWDAAIVSPTADTAPRGRDNYGPVEMDTIFAPEGQPPSLTHIYNNRRSTEYLTDRFGFIYDQRRKRRQREAAQMTRHLKSNSRSEPLTNGRISMSPVLADDDGQFNSGATADIVRPGSPSSISLGDAIDEPVGKPKRWQDYLKIATFPTELLSDTPSINAPSIEVLDGGDENRSPGLIISDDRGLVPPAATAVAATVVGGDIEGPTGRDREHPSTVLAKDDTEPVKLLLKQLNEIHDNHQREKTIRWNEFLRKVRAERRREGEAAAAAAAAAAATTTTSSGAATGATAAGFQKAVALMPEEKLTDGELVGISGLGNKGKVGRAKWNEFKSLVLGGIPVSYRAKIWSECSGASALRVPGYYDDLVALSSGRRAGTDGDGDGKDTGRDPVDPTVVSQIEMDIRRTLRDNVFFRSGPGVEKLREVLLAYARRNTEVGYCQGMNLICANLLLITPSAEEAFWLLATMIEQILPHGYYDHSLRASRADQQVLRSYVAEVLPRLSRHLEGLGVELEALTFQWFLSVFTDCLSAEALLRVWDVVLCTHDGSTFLFHVALALLKLNEAALLGSCDTPAKVYTYIGHQMTNHAISIDGLLAASEALRKLVKREDVEARRKKALADEEEMVKRREVEREAYRNRQKAVVAAAAVGAVGKDGQTAVGA